MDVVLVYPMGYCQGVAKAIELALKAKKENPKKKVYLLGSLVHNEETLNLLKKKGLILLEEKDGDLDSLLRQIEDGQVVVFSAHGHDKKLDEIAKNKNLIIYDSTCPFVEKNLQEALSQGHQVIYLGQKGHAEANAFLSNCPNAIFYEVGKPMPEIDGVSSPFIVSQTTLSYSELEEAHKEILEKFPNAIIGPERCLATTLRQQGVSKLGNDVEALIVVGSPTSANSVKLASIGKEKGLETHLVKDLKQLKLLDLKGIKKIGLASGASTPIETIKNCAKYLRKLNK